MGSLIRSYTSSRRNYLLYSKPSCSTRWSCFLFFTSSSSSSVLLFRYSYAMSRWSCTLGDLLYYTQRPRSSSESFRAAFSPLVFLLSLYLITSYEKWWPDRELSCFFLHPLLRGQGNSTGWRNWMRRGEGRGEGSRGGAWRWREKKNICTLTLWHEEENEKRETSEGCAWLGFIRDANFELNNLREKCSNWIEFCSHGPSFIEGRIAARGAGEDILPWAIFRFRIFSNYFSQKFEKNENNLWTFLFRF